MLSPHCLLWLSTSDWAEREGARSEDRAPNRLSVGACMGQAAEVTTMSSYLLRVDRSAAIGAVFGNVDPSDFAAAL